MNQPPPVAQADSCCGSCDWLSEETAKNILKVALGALAAIVFIPLMSIVHKHIIDLMADWGCDMTPTQDVVQIWSAISSLPVFFSFSLYRSLILLNALSKFTQRAE